MRLRWMALALGLASALGACQDTDFFYHDPPVIGETVRFRSRIVQQSGFGGVDILWVIDNSISMNDHQQSVAANTALFMSRFKPGIRWKMGLISTSYYEDPYVGFAPGSELDDHTAAPAQVFMDAVGRLGLDGSVREQTFQPILRALSRYPDFLTPGSALAIVAVTDAEEQSSPGSAQGLLSLLAQAKGDLKSTFFYGVFEAVDLGCPDSDDSQWNFAASPYETFLKATQGKIYPLCSQGFGANLAGLADDLFSRITNPRIYLRKRPQATTLSVSYRGTRLPGGLASRGGYWIYDYASNSVVFHSLDFAQGDLEEVDIEFVEDVGSRQG